MVLMPSYWLICVLIPTSLGEAYILIPIYPISVSFSTINMIDGTMIFSYMRRLGFKILNFNFFFWGGGGGGWVGGGGVSEKLVFFGV